MAHCGRCYASREWLVGDLTTDGTARIKNLQAELDKANERLSNIIQINQGNIEFANREQDKRIELEAQMSKIDDGGLVHPMLISMLDDPERPGNFLASCTKGMTLRQRYAGLFHAALLPTIEASRSQELAAVLAAEAVLQADALILELKKPDERMGRATPTDRRAGIG